MKRILVLLLAAVFIFTLASCAQNNNPTQAIDDPLGREDDTKKPTEAPNNQGQSEEPSQGGVITRPGVTFEAVLNYVETGSTEMFEPHVLTLSEQQELKASVEKDGGTITFDADGTIRITGEGQSSLVLHPDGTFTGVDADGKEFGFNTIKEWPDDRFGNAVPRPELEIEMVQSDKDGLTALFGNVTIEQIKQYAAQLENAGYTIDSNTLDMPDYGMFTYSGSNGEFTAEVLYMTTEGKTTASLSVSPVAGMGDEPEIPTFPPEYTDLDEEFEFLLSDGGQGFEVIDNGGFTSIEPSDDSLKTIDNAKRFKTLALNEGWTLQTESDITDDNGKHFYFASVVSSSGSEIHISFQEAENVFYVDCIPSNNGGDPIPVDTQPWPTTGPLTLLPKPTFGQGFVVREQEESVAVQVVGANYDNFGEYVQKMKSAGFVNDPEHDDDPNGAMYIAFNDAGYEAYVSFYAGVFVIEITNEPEIG